MLRHHSSRLAEAIAVLLPLSGWATPTPTTGATFEFCGKTLNRSARHVECHDARVTDITALAGLRDLESLDLAGSGVSSLAPLRAPHGTTGLRWVKLTGAPIEDLHPLQNHPHVERLDIDKTRVTDLAPLSSHRSLSALSLNDSQVRSIEPVLGLPKLSQLRFQRTPALTEAAIMRLAQSKTIHMSGDQVRLLALFRLLENKPAGLLSTRHPNGTIKDVGILRQGQKDGWWAVFDEQGDLLEEHDFWQGEPTREVFNWSYNRYNCVESSPHETHFLRGCLLDHLTLTRDERLGVLKRAERLLHDHRGAVVSELLSAAFVDDAKVRAGIGRLLVKVGALRGESGGLLPSRKQLAKHLRRFTKPLGKDFQSVRPEHCRLLPGKTSGLTVSCSELVGCEHACQERIAHLTIAITPAGATSQPPHWPR